MKLHCLILILCAVALSSHAAQPDQPFRQAVSVKYLLADELRGAQLRKMVVDYDDVVHVLSDRGLLRVVGQQLVKDLSYRPLADIVPLDIGRQEATGFLYYLYSDRFLTNAQAGKPHGTLPSTTFDRLAVNQSGDVFLSGPKSLGLFSEGKLRTLKPPGGQVLDVQAYHGQFYLLTDRQLLRLENDHLIPIHETDGTSSMTFRDNEIILGTANGYHGFSATDGLPTFDRVTRVPVPHITQLAVSDSGLWAATPQGAFVHQKDGSFRYYASPRWLDQDTVIDLASDRQGNMYLLTATGLNQVYFKELTLADKAAYFENKIRQRHMRYGLIAELRLKTPGDITTAEMVDTDNDGLWTSFYLGSQAFRYAVTGAEKARRNAWESFAAYERLLSINQLVGFPSRTFRAQRLQSIRRRPLARFTRPGVGVERPYQ